MDFSTLERRLIILPVRFDYDWLKTMVHFLPSGVSFRNWFKIRGKAKAISIPAVVKLFSFIRKTSEENKFACVNFNPFFADISRDFFSVIQTVIRTLFLVLERKSIKGT